MKAIICSALWVTVLSTSLPCWAQEEASQSHAKGESAQQEATDVPPELATAHDAGQQEEAKSGDDAAHELGTDDAEDAQGNKAAKKKKYAKDVEIGIFGRPVRRQGFHFQVGFGVGGGPDTSGLFHTMEIGYTWRKHTFAMLHTFIQNKGIMGTDSSEPDLIGGWMLEYKYPIFIPELVGKIALGLGGIHEQEDGIKAHGGFGASYGLDFHFPVTQRFGPTLTLAGMNVTALGQHHFGAGLALGVTWF